MVVSPHTNHEVGTLEDVRHLRLHAAVDDRIWQLAKFQLTTKQIQLEIGKEIREGIQAGSSGSSSSGSKSGSSLVAAIQAAGTTYLQSFQGRRLYPSKRDIKKIQQQVARSQRLHANDVQALEDLISSWQALGDDSPVLFYQPQELDADGNITQHFVLELSALWPCNDQRFGAGEDRMVLLDATGGTNQYGYQLYGMLAVDEWREGVPGAFMITSSQEATEVETFLQVRQLG